MSHSKIEIGIQKRGIIGKKFNIRIDFIVIIINTIKKRRPSIHALLIYSAKFEIIQGFQNYVTIENVQYIECSRGSDDVAKKKQV